MNRPPLVAAVRRAGASVAPPRVAWVAALVALFGAPLPAAAEITYIYTCGCNDYGHRYGASAEVPLFIGSNTLSIVGRFVDLATGVRIQGLPDARIVERSSGRIKVTFAIPVGTSLSTRTIRVTYLTGEDRFQSRIWPKGQVRSISAPSTVRVNEVFWIRFDGAAFGNAMLGDKAPGGLRESGTHYVSDTSFRTQAVFRQCGKFIVIPYHLYARGVNYREVENGNAPYLGSVRANIEVTGCTYPVVDVNGSTRAPPIPTPTQTGSLSFTHDYCRWIDYTFRWGTVSPSTGYEIAFWRDGNPGLRVNTGTTTSFNTRAALPNTTSPPVWPPASYQWRVRAYRAEIQDGREYRHWSAYSAAQGFSVRAPTTTTSSPTRGVIGATTPCYR